MLCSKYATCDDQLSDYQTALCRRHALTVFAVMSAAPLLLSSVCVPLGTRLWLSIDALVLSVPVTTVTVLLYTVSSQ